jgi:hypothetical protein
MSYCRWSSDDYRCDLYVYEDESGGFTVHVAGNRVPDETPRCTAKWLSPEWFAQHQAQMAFLETAERTPIGLSRDGESFTVPTLEDLRALVLDLRREGYRFPDALLHVIDDEIAERDLNASEVQP